MKIATSVWTGLALLAMAQAAEAAPPKVSGIYALMIFTQCQAGFTTTTDNYMRYPSGFGPAVKTLMPVPAGSGELNISVGTITFDALASSGTATFEAYIVSGASLKINGAGGAIGVHLEAAPGTFSFTDTEFTFDPDGADPAMIWNFRAGAITVSNGLARTLYMTRRENAKCVNALTATKK